MDYNLSSPVHVSRSLGFKRGKNDRIDSFRLAWYCYTFRQSLPLCRMKEGIVIRLRELMNEHSLYVRQLFTHKGYLTEYKNRETTPVYRRALAGKAYFEQQIADIEKEMEELIRSDQSFHYQSGSSVRARTKVSKAGARQQKADLSQAAKSAARCDNEIRRYYERKTEERKAYGTVMNAIQFKLVGRMFAVVKRGTPWVDINAFAN